jgi:hypothetical protein
MYGSPPRTIGNRYVLIGVVAQSGDPVLIIRSLQNHRGRVRADCKVGRRRAEYGARFRLLIYLAGNRIEGTARIDCWQPTHRTNDGIYKAAAYDPVTELCRRPGSLARYAAGR